MPAKAQKDPAPAGESAAAQTQRARLARGKSPNPAAFPPIPGVADDTVPARGGAVEHINIKACLTSPLNPRKTFPAEEIRELADSIAENGLLQPLTGRVATDYLERLPNAREIFIGGRRLRALELLYAEDRWPHDKLPGGHLVPVIRRDVDDLELLTIAVAENVNRADMHPLEEGSAFAELRKRGRSLDEIAQAYGKTKRWVEQRIQVATGLDDRAKDLFSAGKINMEAARVLVRLPEAERKGVVTAITKGDAGYENAAAIKARIAEGLPEVSKALFDRTLYTGDTEMGGRYQSTERFSDAEQFRTLQLAAIETRRAELEKKWAFVKQVKVKAGNHYFIPSDHGLDQLYNRADPAVHGAAIVVFHDLKVEIIEGVCEGKAPPEPTKAEAKASGDPVAALGTGWREHAHRCKTVALQSSILRTGHRAALELAVIALLGDGTIAKIRTESTGPESRALAPELFTRLQAWRERLGGKAFEMLNPDARGFDAFLAYKGGYTDADLNPRIGVYEMIGRLADAEVTDLFDLLVASRCGSWPAYSHDGPSIGDKPVTILAAERYGVDMAAAWRIDADYLAKLQRADLLALARQINAWCKANRRPGLSVGEDTLAGYKVADARDFLARHVADQDVRLVPAEMTFAGRASIEKALRTPTMPKAAEPEQLDLVDAINATESRRASIGAGLQRLLDEAAPAAFDLEIVCHVDISQAVRTRLQTELGAINAAIGAGATLHVDKAEYVRLMRQDARTLEVFSHHRPDGIEPARSRLAPKNLAAALRLWLDQPQDKRRIDTDAPITATVFWNSPIATAQLLADLAPPLLRHPAFGEREIWLEDPNGPAGKVLLDQSSADVGSYYIIGLEDTFGDRGADPTIERVLRGWLASVTPSEPPAPPAGQKPDDATDAAIDELFDEPQAEEESGDEGLPALHTIAFVVSEHAPLPATLLECFADALPRHPEYGNPSLVIQSADGAQITLTSDIVDDPTGDPDRYQITHYRDETVSVCGMTMPAARVEQVITAWLASLATPGTAS